MQHGQCVPVVRLAPLRSAQRPERRLELGREELRLFPGSEVPATVDLVEVDQVAIGAPGPGLRGPIDILWKDRDAHRDRDLGGLLPGRTRRACPAVLPIWRADEV